MSDEELFLWDYNIRTVHAEEVLREKGGSLSSEALKHYMRQAGADEREVQRAYARRVLDEQR